MHIMCQPHAVAPAEGVFLAGCAWIVITAAAAAAAAELMLRNENYLSML